MNIQTNMYVEKLIEAVKIRPIIYETNTKSYEDTTKEEVACMERHRRRAGMHWEELACIITIQWKQT